MIDETAYQDVANRCIGVRTLMTARAVTRMFDAAMKPIGLTGTQFTLLIAIGSNSTGSISELGQLLNIEKSTLSRNLKPLTSAGLIERDTSKSGRAIAHQLTLKGEETLAKAYPIWQSLLTRIESNIAEDEMQSGFDFLRALRTAAAE